MGNWFRYDCYGLVARWRRKEGVCVGGGGGGGGDTSKLIRETCFYDIAASAPECSDDVL
jgi:hypothetical protein